MTIICLTGCSFLASSAIADKLPASAKPFTSDEVKKLYLGNSTFFGNKAAFYFAQDSSVIGYYDKGYSEGAWTVDANQSCMMTKGTDLKTKISDGKTYKDCWQWFRDAKGKVWTLWSVRYTGKKPPKNDYYTNEINNFKSGDKISAKFHALKGS